MKVLLVLSAIFLFACATMPLTPEARMVTYLDSELRLPKTCERVGTLVGRPGQFLQGSIGNNEARIDLRNQAGLQKINYLVETDASWSSGYVTASAFKCGEGPKK